MKILLPNLILEKDSTRYSTRKTDYALFSDNDRKSKETAASGAQKPRQSVDQLEVQNSRQKHPEILVHSRSAQRMLLGLSFERIARLQFHDFHFYLRQDLAHRQTRQATRLRFCSFVSPCQIKFTFLIINLGTGK